MMGQEFERLNTSLSQQLGLTKKFLVRRCSSIQAWRA